MMRYAPFLIALLLAAPVWGAGWPADSVLYASGGGETAESERDKHRDYAYASLPTCDAAAEWTTAYVNNSSANTACDGTGAEWSLCVCESTTWQPVNTGGAGCTNDCSFTGSTDFEDIVIEGEFDLGTSQTLAVSATPSVAGGSIWTTGGSGPPITDFADGYEGQYIFVWNSGDIVTFDCTSSQLICGTTDIVTTNLDAFIFVNRASQWHMESFKDNSLNYNELVTYAALSATSSIGFGATQVPQGDLVLPLAGGAMTGPLNAYTIDLETNQFLTFGDLGEVEVYWDGSDFQIDSYSVGGGSTVFYGALSAADWPVDLHSTYGGLPLTLVISDAKDKLTSVKRRGSLSGARRALTGVVDIDITGTLANNATSLGVNGFVYTSVDKATTSNRTTSPGGATGGLYSFRHQASGTFRLAGGVASNCTIVGADEDGLIEICYGFLDAGGDGGAATGEITHYAGLLIFDSKGNVAYKDGIWAQDLTNATYNVGFRIDGATTYGLWFANSSGTSNDGIWFGACVDLYDTGTPQTSGDPDNLCDSDGTTHIATTADVNLYRSAADTLKTDDDFIAGGTITGGVSVIVTTDGTETVTMLGQRYIADHDTGTSDTVYTLPAAAIGLSGCFYDNGDGNGGIDLTPVGDDHIQLYSLDAAALEVIKSPAAGPNGDFICLLGVSTTEWVTLSYSGTWTEATPP